MRTVSKLPACFLNLSHHMIDGKLFAKHIIPCDKNHMRLRQFIEILSLLQRVHIHQAAMVSGTLWGRSFPVLLNLHVKLVSFSIYGNAIQDCRPALQVLVILLDYLFQHPQLLSVHNNLQDIFCTFRFLKHIPHKHVAHQCKLV